jgi:hypothetical protein
VTTIFGGCNLLSPQGGGLKAIAHYVQDFSMKLSLVPFKKKLQENWVFIRHKVMGFKVNLLVSKHFRDLSGFNETNGMYGRESRSLPLIMGANKHGHAQSVEPSNNKGNGNGFGKSLTSHLDQDA